MKVLTVDNSKTDVLNIEVQYSTATTFIPFLIYRISCATRTAH